MDTKYKGFTVFTIGQPISIQYLGHVFPQLVAGEWAEVPESRKRVNILPKFVSVRIHSDRVVSFF